MTSLNEQQAGGCHQPAWIFWGVISWHDKFATKWQKFDFRELLNFKNSSFLWLKSWNLIHGIEGISTKSKLQDGPPYQLQMGDISYPL